MEKISTSYLEFLTDDFSIWQHSRGLDINYSKGYALDDAARALIFVLNFGPRALAPIFYNFIARSLCDDLINFYDKDRKPLRTRPSEDAAGQTYWALALWHQISPTVYLNKIEALVERFGSPRGLAYSLIGASQNKSKTASTLFFRLNQMFMANMTVRWPWVEKNLTYGNAIIPLSFWEYYNFSHDPESEKNGRLMLDFLNKEMKFQNIPITIGNKGWYTEESNKALFDQQPIDIAYQVIANIRAYEITKDKHYLDEAILFFTWFWGNNLHSTNMIDLTRQRCFDGLREKSISKNAGAESIICFLWAQETLWPHLKELRTVAPVNQNKTLENFFGDLKHLL